MAKAKVRMTKQICLEFMFFDTDNPRRYGQSGSSHALCQRHSQLTPHSCSGLAQPLLALSYSSPQETVLSLLPCHKSPQISWRAALWGKCHLQRSLCSLVMCRQLSPHRTSCTQPSATGTASVQPPTKCDPNDRDALEQTYSRP